MAVKKRRITPRKGAASAAPKPSSGGIKKRSTMPVAPDEVDTFPGELGNMVSKITDSNDYGRPFKRGDSSRLNTHKISTGILAVDLALGGGWTESRAGMLYGEKSSGKSTMALLSIAEMQRQYPDRYAAWIDIEGTFDNVWARKLGVDLSRVAIVEPESGEHAVDIADQMLRAREIGLVATDSIAMLVPMKEIEDSTEQDHMALQARLVGKYIRKTNNALIRERGRNHSPILIHINQFRMKVGLVFGDPRVLPGGKALEFSTTQQIEVKNKENKGKDSDKNDVVLFNQHDIKITKNKGGGPMKEAAFKLIRAEGHEGLPEGWIDQAKTIYAYGSQVGIIQGAPSSYEVDGIGKFRGAPSLNAWALENREEYRNLQLRIIAAFQKKWNL